MSPHGQLREAGIFKATLDRDRERRPVYFGRKAYLLGERPRKVEGGLEVDLYLTDDPVPVTVRYSDA